MTSVSIRIVLDTVRDALDVARHACVDVLTAADAIFAADTLRDAAIAISDASRDICDDVCNIAIALDARDALYAADALCETATANAALRDAAAHDAVIALDALDVAFARVATAMNFM